MAGDFGIEAGSRNGTTLVVVLVFLSLCFYNVLELTLIIFTTFKRRSGLYFWSFIISTWGVAIWSLGFLLKNTGVASHIPNAYLLYMTFVEVGFVCMVTGQSVVLYSRLHIVLHSRKKLRFALAMIIFDGIICHVPIIVVAFGTNSPNPEPFIVPYSVYEKVQVTIFFIQELILSGLYISETVKMMRIERHMGVEIGHHGGSRKLMKHLVLVNVIIIALDITILGLEYAGYYTLQTAYKGLVYSVKLKMEFSILNRLMEMVRGVGAGGTSSGRAHTIAIRSRVDKVDKGDRVEAGDMVGGVDRVDQVGVAMDTLDGAGSAVAGKRRVRVQDAEYGGIGYSASAYRGEHDDFGRIGHGVRRDNRPVITRTTEVMVHRDDLDDSDSINTDKHGNYDTGRAGGDASVSTSSSEVQFAKA
ncbi:hypothetical protein MFIFM68171_06638 [Madurella fahalii]|uniref:DUF7703 domain-containing protein n=1 Tax=Madurella fahalii TaxID=1157608 RepID=A0ABQ0GF88_9PEZI